MIAISSFDSGYSQFGDFLVVQMVKNLLAMWEIGVRSLGQEDPLEKGMATHSNIFAWRIPWTEENPMNWWATVLRVAKSQTQLSPFSLSFSQ